MTGVTVNRDLLLIASLKIYFLSTFDDSLEQQDEFSSAVLAFSLFFRYGFDPCTKLGPNRSEIVSSLAEIDHDFTGVAW